MPFGNIKNRQTPPNLGYKKQKRMKHAKTEKIQARLTPNQKRRLRKAADARGVTVSRVIQEMVEAGPLGGLAEGASPAEREFMGHLLNYASARPDLRPLAYWLAANRQYMLADGHLLTAEERAHWAGFMAGLTRVFSSRVGAAVDLDRQKAQN